MEFNRYRYLIGRIIKRNTYVKLVLVFFVFFVVGTIGTYLFEKRVNENFITVSQSFWTSTVYLLSGFEDFAPTTIGGRIMSILIFICSICIIGSVAGNFATIFMRRKEARMPKGIEKHIVICNWNNRGDKIVKELHHPNAEPEIEIVVITNRDINEQELRGSKEYQKVFFIKSDSTLHTVLETAKAHLAKIVIILANDESSDPDAESILITLAVIKLCNTATKPHIIAQAVNYEKSEYLKDIGVDDIICATNYEAGILAECALQSKLSEVYNQLLSHTKATNKLYMIENEKVSKAIDGKTFEEVAEWLNKNRDPHNPAILLGIRRGKQVILNPRKRRKEPEEIEFETFQQGDTLVVIAFDPPDLSKLVK